MSTDRKTPEASKDKPRSRTAAAKKKEKAAAQPPVTARTPRTPKPATKPAAKTAAKTATKSAKQAASTPSSSAAPPPVPAVRVGIGGWTYEDWRNNFYPADLPHAKELQYASRQLTAIEVNGTYYSSFKPPTFRKWHDETPDDFVFALKAIRFATNRKVLASAKDSVDRFVDSGIAELGDKLGPIVWQFMPTKAFDPEDFEAFLALLPAKVDGRTLRHVMDVRHPSFLVPEYPRLARRYGVSTVFTDAEKFPSFEEPEGEIAYARLMMAEGTQAQGYAPAALDRWAERARGWAAHRPTFVFFINGAKEKAPAAAGALLKRLGWHPAQD